MTADYEIGIEDFGAGIPEHLMNNLFSDFGNLEVHRQQNPEGRGLGLSISKMIVESFGGYIDVKSEVGKGTKFTLFFPAFCRADGVVVEENI